MLYLQLDHVTQWLCMISIFYEIWPWRGWAWWYHKLLHKHLSNSMCVCWLHLCILSGLVHWMSYIYSVTGAIHTDDEIQQTQDFARGCFTAEAVDDKMLSSSHPYPKVIDSVTPNEFLNCFRWFHFIKKPVHERLTHFLLQICRWSQRESNRLWSQQFFGWTVYRWTPE